MRNASLTKARLNPVQAKTRKNAAVAVAVATKATAVVEVGAAVVVGADMAAAVDAVALAATGDLEVVNGP